MGPDGDLELSSSRAAPPQGLPQRATSVAFAAALGAVALFAPVKLCVIALALRIPCPGCGMTRATIALLRGDFAEALALHPLAPVIAPLAAGFLIASAAAYVRTGAAFGTGRVPRALERMGAGLVLLLFAVWLARFFGCFGGPVSVS